MLWMTVIALLSSRSSPSSTFSKPKIRAVVLDTFGFENVQLGEDLLLSNAITVIQSIRGITYVDIDVFDKISEAQLLDGFTGLAASNLTLNHRIMVEPARVDKHEIKAAQLAYLTPDVPDTLILQEIKP